MGSRLQSAVIREDVEYVRKHYKDNSGDRGSKNGPRNLLHAAVERDRYTFLLKTLKMLSSHPKCVINLINQKQSKNGDNPLHCAARQGNIFTLKLLVNAYTRAVSAVGSNQQTPPWLAKNSDEGNPLCCSLGKDMTTQENIARYLVSQDEHLLRTLGQARYPVDQCSTLILDKRRESIVFIGMKKGFSQLVKQILTSHLPYALTGHNGETPLHYASRCNEQVSRLLFEKHHELIGEVSLSGKTMLSQAVEDGATWLVRLMLTQEEGTKYTIPYWPRVPWTKACRRLIWHMNKDGDTPLHIAARKGDIEISKLLIQGFKSALQEETEDYCDSADDMFEPGYDLMGVNPLYLENIEQDIPLVLALRHKHDDCGVMLSMETFPLVENYSLVPLYTKCLPVAMDNACLSSAKMILERVISQGLGSLGNRLHGAGIKSPGVRKIADHITAKYKVKQEMIKSEEFEKFLEVLPRFQGENEKDANAILREAAERGEDWLVRMVLECDESLFRESAPAWQVACEKGHLSTLHIFINLQTHDAFIELCREMKQTPLHHLKLLHFEEYVELLKKPVFEKLKNEIDCDGATPLYRAIQRDDINFTRALLETKGIDVGIKDNNGITALDLLEKRCKLSKTWGKMCREIEQDSTVKKLKHLFRKISFQGMQNSLSVVAALVATLTFAAGFTVPGGLDSKDGTPVLATKAAFLAFSISNTIAMCSSVMVLFVLLGPLMWDLYPSLFYVNMSLYLLMMSLGGTMMAFMAGTYAIIAPKTMGDASFIIILCSSTLFMACIFWLLTYSARFKEHLSKLFAWPKKVLWGAIMWAVRALSTSQKPPRKLNAPPTQASNNIDLMDNEQSGSSNTRVTPASDNIEANVQPRISNTPMTQDFGDIIGDVQSGISKKPIIQDSSNPPTKTQTPSLNGEGRQFSDTSPLPPNDIKIEIRRS